VILRYLHLPRCGPLIDTSVVFGHEKLIAKALNLPRKGALNFVVGVNGTGKSSLLRALYHIFRSLNLREWPALPVTIAWDRTLSGEPVTTLLHSTNLKNGQSFFATLKQVSATVRRQDWEGIAAAMSKGEPHHLIQALEITTGADAITSPLLFARLPKRLIAYTSGLMIPGYNSISPSFTQRTKKRANTRPKANAHTDGVLIVNGRKSNPSGFPTR
jgi:energy-coupling factor transporter ATP-binding protein EcfA2